MGRKYHDKIPRILVLIDPSLGSVSSIQHGIQRYAKLYGPWELNYMIGSGPELRNQLKRERHPVSYTGVLARLLRDEDVNSALAFKEPTVLIDPPNGFKKKPPSGRRFSLVALDVDKVGSLAVDFFLKKRIRHFGFVPTEPDTDWSREHGRAYAEELARRGIIPSLYSPSFAVSTKKHLAAWLQKLPKPAAVFTPSEQRGREILAACRDLKISVPYEILLLAVGNDEIFCESCFPSLSSITVHWQRGGFAAAEILDLAMRRSLKRPRSVVYEAFEVVARDSCREVPRTESPTGAHRTNNCVILALEFIRINSGFGIQVENVAKHAGVSRQWLEKKFKAETGHSVLDDIRRHRMERIKALLQETDLPINRIAEMSGYENANHLRIVFKKEFKMSMTDYRLRFGTNR